MGAIDLSPVKELYHLWNPVYPYLLRQIEEIYGRRGGAILEVGPFCGAIFALQTEGIGSSFLIASFPDGMGDFFREEARRLKVDDSVRIIDSAASLIGIKNNSVDLVIFRGALFFPSLFQVDFSAVYRVLKDDGVALIGGGFGQYTPPGVIKGIAEKSRELNLQIGKIEVTEGEIQKKIGPGLSPGDIEIVSQGGLWIIMRK